MSSSSWLSLSFGYCNTPVPLLSLLACFLSYYLMEGHNPDLQDTYTTIGLFKLMMLPFKAACEGQYYNGPTGGRGNDR